MLLQLHQVSKSFTSTGSVLRGLDLEVAAGDTVAIVGPSGSGKSTILNLIGALDRPDQGEVLVEGRNIGGLKEAEVAAYRNETVGFVFQLHHLLPQCTVLENVLVPTLAAAHPDAKAAQARALELLRSVGLQGRKDHRPGQLSGGERQRVALGRALLMQPRLLLLDEPLGSLDSARKAEILPYLIRLRDESGVPMVYVSHDPHELRQLAAQVVVIERGHVAAFGDADSVLADVTPQFAD